MMTLEHLTDSPNNDLTGDDTPVALDTEGGRPPQAMAEYWPADATRQRMGATAVTPTTEFTD
jgi:hypothetical protein